MQIKIRELQDLMLQSLRIRGLSTNEAKIVAEALIEAELMGKKTHGIGKIFLLEDAIKLRGGKPEIIKDKGNYTLVRAHKELGHISAQFAVDVLLKKAKEFENAVVATIDSFYYAMAGTYARKISEAGFVSIILNNGGPATITPFGGVDPLFGTNPVAIGIPTDSGPIVLDMSTGERPWGEVNLAKIERRQLQDKTFLDKEGAFTTDPYKVEAIIPFGGYKGYGLNFMFEIMTGALIGAKMGLESKNGYDLGFVFMAFSPEMFTTKETFDRSVKQLIKHIKASRKAMNVSEIYLPGEKSSLKYKKAIDAGTVEIEQETFDRLREFASGEDIKNKVGLKQ